MRHFIGLCLLGVALLCFRAGDALVLAIGLIVGGFGVALLLGRVRPNWWFVAFVLKRWTR
jgi:hypothetical protein